MIVQLLLPVIIVQLLFHPISTIQSITSTKSTTKCVYTTKKRLASSSQDVSDYATLGSAVGVNKPQYSYPASAKRATITSTNSTTIL